MAFNLKTLLNPAPPSGSSTPLPPPADSTEHEMTEQTTEHNESAGRARATADKLAGLTLDTTVGTMPLSIGSEAQRPTSSSRSPVDMRTSPSSANAAYAYAAPITSLSSEAPALQSFIPAQVDRGKLRVASSGSAGGSSLSPPPAGSVFVKEEEDDDSPIISSKEEVKPSDPATQATVQALRNEHGLRGSVGHKKSESATPSLAPEVKNRPPKKPAAKKGMAKKASTSGATKKRKSSDGVKKPSNEKKPDILDEDDDMLEFDESEAEDDIEDDGEEEEEVYCICRKPDDHKYMIGCDGGCGDWFHGTCVKISEDQGRLIDKFICVNCSEATRGSLATTWRPICRYSGCMAPARVENTVVKSLYCSDDHGRAFWASIMRDQKLGASGKNAARVKKSAKLGLQETGRQGYHRGGALPPSILKALLANVTTVSAFQSLGESMPLPNHVEMPDISNLNSIDSKTTGLSPEDLTELDNISKTRTSLISRRTAAQNRSKLLSYAISRRDRTIAKLGIKRSAWCGYDADLVLPPSELADRVAFLEQKSEVKSEDAMEDEEDIPDSVCQKKNCGVHGKWADTEKQDSWMEIRLWTQRIEELDRRVEEIGEAAARRGTASSSHLMS